MGAHGEGPAHAQRPRVAAGLLLREPELVRHLLVVAEGFAQCSPDWLTTGWAELPLPLRALLELGILVALG
jgi:hypothetical protein